MSVTNEPVGGLAKASNLLARPWTLLIVDALAETPLRFTEIVAQLRGISTNLLTERLRVLTGNGIVCRSPTESASTYELTTLGRALLPVLDALSAWGENLADLD